MRKLNLWMASSAVGLVVMASSVSIAPALTLSGDTELSGLTYNGGPDGSTASETGGIISLYTAGGGGFYDTGQVVIPNTYLLTSGVSLPATLGDLVAGTGGANASFDLVSNDNTASGQYAYWSVELTNGANTVVLNAFGLNTLGENWFSQTSGGTAYSLNGGTPQSLFCNWSCVDGTNVAGTDLGLWTLAALDVSVGGWSDVTETDTINSVTVTPLPASVWLFAGGLGFMGLLGWRKKRKGETSVWPTQVAEGAALAA